MEFFQQNKSTLSGTRAQALVQARARLISIVMLLMIGYLAVSLRLFDLTLLRQNKIVEAVAKADIKPLEKGLRGLILDRYGNQLATSLKMASVYADTTLIEAPETLAKQLTAILPEQNGQELLRKLTSGKRFIWIQRNVTPRQEYAINALGNPALGFQAEARRMYPAANLMAHITGYTDVDGNGIAGIEKYFDKQLSETGDPVQLTIDLRLQHILHRELGKALRKFRAKDAIGMVMDVNTGEILAMVSLPDFDPNRATDAADTEKFNRATLGVFEMGSTFKLFSTAAALESDKVRFSTVFDATEPLKIGRFTISDFHPKHRPLTVPEIFIYSSNIGTAKMAMTVGDSGMQDFFETLGFMKQAPVELPERGTPLYPSPWRSISTLTTSYGHGIAVSPLHLLRAASALVNGGILPTSTLIKPKQQGRLSLTPDGARVVRESTSDRLRQLLELVVVAGTGNNAYVEGYHVGGKTGTAEKTARGGYNQNERLSSFIGVFPIQNPRFAVLAILDEPQATEDTKGYATGGWTAAPVVARVIEQMGPLYRIPPDMGRSPQYVQKEMSVYLKEWKEGSTLASLGTDH